MSGLSPELLDRLEFGAEAGKVNGLPYADEIGALVRAVRALEAEVARLESFGLMLYDSEGVVVLEMPLLGRDCRWTMGSPGPLEVARVEVRSLTS